MGILDTPARLRPPFARNTVSAIGDSVTHGGYTDATTVSGPTFGPRSYLASAVLQSGARIIPGTIAATDGFTTAAMIATHLPTILAERAQWCVVHGGINDVQSSVAATTTIANLKTIFDSLLVAGIIPIGTSALPSTTYSGTARQKLDQIQAFVSYYGQLKGFPVVDWTTPLIKTDGSGAWTTGLSDDGVHPNPSGVELMGLALANVLIPYLRPLTSFLTMANANLASVTATYPTWDNGLNLLDTNVDGIPNGWSQSNSPTTPPPGSTPTNPTMGADGLGNWFKMAAAGGGNTYSFVSNSHTVTAGHRYLLAFKIKTASVNANGATWRATFSTGGSIDVGGLRDLTRDVVGVGTWLQLVTIPTSLANTSCAIRLAVGGAAADLYTGQMTLINLTAGGMV